jgi:predicted Zn-dependent protease
MADLDQPSRPKGSLQFWTIFIAAGVLVSIIGIAVLAGVIFFSHGKLVNLDRYDQAPPDRAPYIGTDKLPNGLSAPLPIFTEAHPAVSAALYANVPMQPQIYAFDKIAEETANLPSPPLPPLPSTAPADADPAKTGLLVCSPQDVSGSSTDVNNFGVACGEWLHIISAGQPLLGRTPEMADMPRIASELNRKAFNLGPSDIKALAAFTSITDVACGTISGSKSSATLKYQMYTLPSVKPVGSPISVTGTFDQINAQLPDIARKIDVMLGINSPSIPTSTGISGAEMIWLGNYLISGTNSTSDVVGLSKLADRSPIAGLLLFSTWAANDQLILDRTVKNLMTKLPDNAIALNEIGYSYPDELRLYATQTAALFKKYPGNALFAHTEVWEQRGWGSPLNEILAANRCIADSPNDPTSWLSPGQSLSNIAEDLRQGRLTKDITETEWTYLDALYSQLEKDRKEATVIDPKYGHAWKELAEAASYNSDDATESFAAQKAESLEENKSELYIFELEMYQPKWGGNYFAVAMAANSAVAADYSNVRDAASVADELNQVGSSLGDSKYQTMASWIMYKEITKYQDAAAKDPTNPLDAWSLAAALVDGGQQSDLRQAIKEYRIAAHFLPNCAAIHFELSAALANRHKNNDEVAELRRTEELSPFYPDVHHTLGNALWDTGDTSGARSELEIAVKLAPMDATVHTALAHFYFAHNDFQHAVVEYTKAVDLEYYDIDAYYYLAQALDSSHRYQDSIDAANKMIEYNDKVQAHADDLVMGAHDTIADDYLNLRRWSDSLNQTHQALAINPSDPTAQENLAEAYWGEGKADEARAQWEVVAGLNAPVTSDVARKFLAEHPAGTKNVSNQSNIE